MCFLFIGWQLIIMLIKFTWFIILISWKSLYYGNIQISKAIPKAICRVKLWSLWNCSRRHLDAQFVFVFCDDFFSVNNLWNDAKYVIMSLTFDLLSLHWLVNFHLYIFFFNFFLTNKESVGILVFRLKWLEKILVQTAFWYLGFVIFFRILYHLKIWSIIISDAV